MTYFCAQAILSVPFSNTFPTPNKIDFYIIVVLDIPEGGKTLDYLNVFVNFARSFV